MFARHMNKGKVLFDRGIIAYQCSFAGCNSVLTIND